MGLEAPELARWTRFAAKGGIGKCTATCDCIAEGPDDLMFLKDDEITVLLQLPDKENIFLGYCEGVVGQFFGSDVHFHAKLKVPVKAKRVSLASRKSPPPSSDNASPIGQPSRPGSSSKTEAEAASSPRDPHFSIDAPQPKSMPPTRASSPPTLSVLHLHAAMIPTVHKQNTHILPLRLTPEPTTPLRINKRPPPQFSHNLSQSVSQPPPSSSVPETFSTHAERSKRESVGMTDDQVGIGLSLLQDLTNGMDSDSDNEDDQRPKPDQNSPAAGTPDFDSYAAEGTQEITVELGYAQSEENYGETQLAGRGKHTVIVEDTPSQTTSARTIMTSIYSDSNTSSGHNNSLPPSDSPVSPSQSTFSTNERRPSLAPSAASTSEWEGASDIYDDYRYSRYSMTGKMSRFSSSAGWTGSVPPTPPLPESNSIGRARTDSDKSKPDSGARSRTDSMNTRSNIHSSSISSEMNLAGGESLLSSLPLLPASEIGIQGSQGSQGSQHQDHLNRTIERPISMESVASVYTQNSRLSTLSQDVIVAMSSGSNANNHLDTSTSSDTDGINPGDINARPAPLLLSQSNAANSPLLHTTWPTPLSSAFDVHSPGRSNLHTPIVGGGVRSPLGFTEEEASKGISDIMTTRSFSPAVNGGGIASAMRQRLETELRSPTPEQTQNQPPIPNTSRKSFTQSDGLGHRIVVEDEDELPSRILDNSVSTFTTMSPEPMYDEDEESDSNKGRRRSDGGHDKRPTSRFSSPDPDLMMLKTHLAPLIIANRTPSPSFSEDGSDEIHGSGSGDEVEDEEEEEDPEAVIIPTAPPLNASTSALPQSSTSSSPAPPRLSSASTIRMGSPPIDLRPPLALSDIREPRGPFVPGSNQRRSLFLPHPNAPKSPGHVSIPGSPGPGVPMYIAVQQGGWARGPGGMIPPASPNVIRVIIMALSTPPGGAIPQGHGPPGQRSPLMIRMRGPTIYGRTETDLTGSLVPVPIMFSIDPPHGTAAQPSSNPNPPSLAPPPQGTPTSHPPSSPVTTSLAPTPQGTPTSVPSSPTQLITKPQQQQHPTGTGAGAAVSASLSDVSPSAGEGDAAEPKATGGLIPRPKFSPKSSGLRPRSRSLSHFNSTDTVVPQQSEVEAEIPSGGDVKRSLTTSVSSLSPLPASSPLGSSKSKLASSRLSPLSLPPNNLRLSALRSPISPLAQPIIPTSPNHVSTGMGNRPQHQLRRETSSRFALNETLPSPSHSFATPRPTMPGSATSSVSSPPLSPPQSLTTSVQAHSRNDADAVSINSDTRHPTRQNSVRTKLSLPNLRRHRSKQEDESSADGDMLQVKDTEFQLVIPNFGHVQSSRPSEDSGVLTKDIDVRQDGNGFLRTESPVSMLSGVSKQSPMSEFPAVSSWSPLSATTPSARVTTESESSMDAHRHREIKWMSLMSSSPASQARKTKKFRKLIMEGVPSSVRYLVWSYLTDGKARCVPGVYTQLCSRGRVPWSADIERDIKTCFRDQPHLQGTQGPVLLLLQSYLNMVPDILYTRGLTLIVGQLLLLAPEEDAFWIFVSIMDTHIRPYFSTATTQMEVDSALFSRALESNDHQVAKKILVDVGITPLTICQPWFSSLFVGTLPPEYLNRIWDLFLFEGIPFLLRVALAIVTCCRLAILESTKEETVLEIFRHPPQSLLPPSPDAFLSLVCSVKLKDDDVRKQRIKMEAQVKRQTKVPRTVSVTGAISLPRA